MLASSEARLGRGGGSISYALPWAVRRWIKSALLVKYCLVTAISVWRIEQAQARAIEQLSLGACRLARSDQTVSDSGGVISGPK